MLRLSVHRRIDEISATEWDGLLGPRDIFHTHRFLRVVERSGIEAAEYWYLCFRREGRLVASAVLSCFRVDLLLLTGSSPPWLSLLRRFRPNLLRPRLLCCGLPVSLGQRNLVIDAGEAPQPVLRRLVTEMRACAERLGVRYLCVKEAAPEDVSRWATLEQAGFFRGHSLPYMSLAVRWADFGAYLGLLRHDYRRQIRKAMAKVLFPGGAEPEPTTGESAQAVVRIGHWEACPPEVFHELYLQVMARSTAKLEVLPLAFFRNCYTALQEDLELITVEQDETVLCAALLFRHPPRLTFALVGNRYVQYPTVDPYFNVLHAIIDQASAGGFAHLGLGQTAYPVKQRLGGEAEARYLYFYSRGPLVHGMLYRLRAQLFPATVLPRVRAFKSVPHR
jgi:predicted N-acyltransferase